MRVAHCRVCCIRFSSDFLCLGYWHFLALLHYLVWFGFRLILSCLAIASLSSFVLGFRLMLSCLAIASLSSFVLGFRLMLSCLAIASLSSFVLGFRLMLSCLAIAPLRNLVLEVRLLAPYFFCLQRQKSKQKNRRPWSPLPS